MLVQRATCTPMETIYKFCQTCPSDMSIWFIKIYSYFEEMLSAVQYYMYSFCTTSKHVIGNIWNTLVLRWSLHTQLNYFKCLSKLPTQRYLFDSYSHIVKHSCCMLYTFCITSKINLQVIEYIWNMLCKEQLCIPMRTIFKSLLYFPT